MSGKDKQRIADLEAIVSESLRYLKSETDLHRRAAAVLRRRNTDSIVTELYAVAVLTSGEWRIGPACNGWDLKTDLTGSEFMCRSVAEELARETAKVRRRGSTKIIRYVRDLDFNLEVNNG
jgi:hypothetical protein